MEPKSKKSSSKARILRIYDILLNHSDQNHKLSKKQICDYLMNEFHITAVANTIDDDMREIVAADVNILVEKTAINGKNVYYYCDQFFDKAEIKMLVDAVNSSRFVTKNISNALINKLIKHVTDEVAEWIRNSVGEGSTLKSENKQVHYIIDQVIDAMLVDKRIRFVYTNYDANKNIIATHDGRPYILSPYNLRWDGEFYYLRGYDHNEKKTKTFRLDRIRKDIQVLDEKALESDEEIDINDYNRKAFRMLQMDQPLTKVKLRCENSMMRYVIDNFGTDVDTEIADENHFYVTTEVFPTNTFFRWIFGWEGRIKIISPTGVIENYKKLVEAALESVNQL